MSEQDTGLRARLIEVGVDLVTSEGMQALSLREIARQAGVSHGAPRRYFPTHLALLSAIARQGFAELTARSPRRSGTAQASPRAQLMALGRVYLDFALTNRGMFELMFRHDLLESNQLGLRETSLPLFEVLVDLVARARPRPDAGAAGRRGRAVGQPARHRAAVGVGQPPARGGQPTTSNRCCVPRWTRTSARKTR